MSDLKPVGVKAPLNLLPLRPLRAISAAMQHGAVKYEPWNWTDNSKPQARINELLGALLRHTLAASDPTEDDFDDESGLHHLAHAGACVILLLYKKGIDYQPSLFVQAAGDDKTPDPPESVPGMCVVDDVERGAHVFPNTLMSQELIETLRAIEKHMITNGVKIDEEKLK